MIQRNESENFAEIFVQVEGLETEEKVAVIEKLRKTGALSRSGDQSEGFRAGPLIEARRWLTAFMVKTWMNSVKLLWYC